MHVKFTLSLLAVAASLLSATSITRAAPTSCKGMEQASCTQTTSCRWVNSYQRTDGKEVMGYCRKLPGKAAKDVSNSGETEVQQAKKS